MRSNGRKGYLFNEGHRHYFAIGKLVLSNFAGAEQPVADWYLNTTAWYMVDSDIHTANIDVDILTITLHSNTISFGTTKHHLRQRIVWIQPQTTANLNRPQGWNMHINKSRVSNNPLLSSDWIHCSFIQYCCAEKIAPVYVLIKCKSM